MIDSKQTKLFWTWTTRKCASRPAWFVSGWNEMETITTPLIVIIRDVMYFKYIPSRRWPDTKGLFTLNVF